MDFNNKKGMGPFKEMASPLNAQVPAADPRAKVAKNTPFGTEMPRDPLGIVPDEK